MRYALINPNWDFTGSIYFGCREPHLPIEFGYSRAILENLGHEVLLIDAQLFGLTPKQIFERVAAFSPDVTVVTTAPSYLFWRCPPPELRVPRKIIENLREIGGIMVAVGPHGSTTPRVVLKKLGVDLVLRGEFEDILPMVGNTPKEWIPSACYLKDGQINCNGIPRSVDTRILPALDWPVEFMEKHFHHHHRFDTAPSGLGAEMETSRGCPFRCSFCAKENFRSCYRKRPFRTVVEELDRLIEMGVEYIYFVDEIFFPDERLLKMFSSRPFKFGIQMRIDLWPEEILELLGQAGCVSIETGVESISEKGRKILNKNWRLGFKEFNERLIFAKTQIPFVQANLIATEYDNADEIEDWREMLRTHGVWANRPVPLFPYPGSPGYRKLWGPPDDFAWERAHEHYLRFFTQFSDIQEQQPLSLNQLESNCLSGDIEVENK